MKVVCSHCGTEFNKPPCQVKRVKRVFCSKKCHDAEQTIFKGKLCEICGETFKVRGNMSRYSTCPKESCRLEKVRREHDKVRKGPKADRVRAIRQADPDRRYLASVKALYGLTAEQYRAMHAAQHGRCAICDRPDTKLVVDHCHSSGVVRGLLCNACNVGLGNFKDNASLLTNAVAYLVRQGRKE